MVAGGGTLPSPDRHDRIPSNEPEKGAAGSDRRGAQAFDHAPEGTEPNRAVTMRGCQGGMPLTTAVDARADTFPKLLVRNARTRPNRTAFRHKDLGVWQSWTWGEVHEIVRAYASGLR